MDYDEIRITAIGSSSCLATRRSSLSGKIASLEFDLPHIEVQSLFVALQQDPGVPAPLTREQREFLLSGVTDGEFTSLMEDCEVDDHDDEGPDEWDFDDYGYVENGHAS